MTASEGRKGSSLILATEGERRREAGSGGEGGRGRESFRRPGCKAVGLAASWVGLPAWPTMAAL